MPEERTNSLFEERRAASSVFRNTLSKKEQGPSLRQIATKFGVGRLRDRPRPAPEGDA